MPNVSNPLGTTQPYIPAVAPTQIGRFAGLAMIFPTVGDLNTAMAASSVVWADGQPIFVAPEFIGGSCWRVWLTGAGHARTVILRPGLTITLAGDDNAVLFAAGQPDDGTGSDGDVSVDWAGNTYYTKAAGTWTSTGSVYAAGSGIPIPADNSGSNVQINSSDGDVYIDSKSLGGAFLYLYNDGSTEYGSDAGDVTIKSSAQNSSNSGAVVIKTGDTIGGDSGSISLTTGTASGTRGDIALDARDVLLSTSGGSVNLYNDSTIAIQANASILIDGATGTVFSLPTSALTLSSNRNMTMTLTSNTNLRISVRGSDGTTRVANITLA